MYISIAKDNSSAASQVGHTATYVMTLDGGYTLFIYFSFTFFIFSLMRFSAVLHGSLGWFPPLSLACSHSWLGQSTCSYFSGGWLELLLVPHCPRVSSIRHRVSSLWSGWEGDPRCPAGAGGMR